MSKPVIVALDYPSESEAMHLADRLDPEKCRVKVGKELFVSAGPLLIKRLVADGFDVFLDLKFHDIPNTVAAAVRASAELGVWMLNVHAGGGENMMKAARDALDTLGEDNSPLIIGVTVLTSMSDNDLAAVGVDTSTDRQVLRLAQLALRCGLDGVVCSAAESASLRRILPASFKLVTPGIRRAADVAADQKRVVGPEEAMANGSDYIVVGRPITQAADPLEALLAFNELAAVS